MTHPEFKKLEAEYGVSLFKLAMRLTRDVDDANDLVQDTWVKVLRSTSYDASNNSKAWLMRILSRLFLDNMRLKKRRISANYLDSDAEVNVCDPRSENLEELIVEKLDLDAQAIEAMKLLERSFTPEECMLLMAKFDDVSYDELLPIMELTDPNLKRGTVRSRMCRVSKKLTSVVEQYQSTREILENLEECV